MPGRSGNGMCLSLKYSSESGVPKLSGNNCNFRQAAVFGISGVPKLSGNSRQLQFPPGSGFWHLKNIDWQIRAMAAGFVNPAETGCASV